MNLPPTLELDFSSVLIALNEMNNSGQSGWAALTPIGDDTEVVLFLSDGTMETKSVHIHTGQCGDALGGVSNGLTSFVGGAGASTTLVEGVSLDSLLTGDFAINSHNSQTGSIYTSCGNIPAESIVLIALNEMNDSGQSGWAKLASRGNDTKVSLSLSTGTMETKSVHIHSGQCGDALGGVVNGLTSYVDGAGASITLVEGVSLDFLLTGDFAINSHSAQTGSIYTACGNIPAEGDTLTIALDEQNDSGQSGWATLSDRGADTEVVLSLSTGTMETKSVHIHTGQCGDALGGVSKGLTSFIDGSGASITLVEGVSLDSLLTGDFAINSHNAQTGSIYTSCGHIPASESMDMTPSPTATAPASTPTTVQATIVNSTLPDLTISVGTTVTWTQADPFAHTTTSGTNGEFDEQGWDSQTLSTNETFSHTFTEAGTFAYTCTIHGYMSGTVTVTDGSGSGDTSTSGDTAPGEDDY